jgi:hypothetical protein
MTVIFILAAMRTSNPIRNYVLLIVCKGITTGEVLKIAIFWVVM